MPEWRELVRARLGDLRIEPTRQAEIIEELSQHLEERYRDGRATGASESDAVAAALAELEDGQLLRELLRSTEIGVPPNPPVLGLPRSGPLNGLGADLRYALRALRRSPAFAAVAILSLALGTGVNAAVFRLLEAIRLRSLPVRAPEQLVDIKMTDRQGLSGQFNGLHPDFSAPLWDRIRERQQGLAGIFAWSTATFNLAEGGQVRNAEGLWVSGDLFSTLGVDPAKGRLFGPADDQPGCPPAAVISYPFWQRELDGDSLVLTRTLSIDGTRVPIIGVTRASFFGVEVGRRFDVAVPLCSDPIIRPGRNYLTRLDAWWLAIGGRLAPGWTTKRVTAHLRAISPGLFEETTPPSYQADVARIYRAYHLGAVAGGNGRSTLRANYESSLWFLLGIGGLVLLIACANVANLLLARASSREREIGARLALGASRGRLLRQLLVESLVLAVGGVGLGVFLSLALSRYLVATLSTTGSPLFLNLTPGGRFFGFTVVVVVATCSTFGLGPALRCTGVPPAGAIRAAGRGLTMGRKRFRAQRLLVVGQVALSMVLLISALLFVRSFRNLVTVDPGFRMEGVVVAELDFSRVNGDDARRRLIGTQLLHQLRTTPGVTAAAATLVIPFQNWWNEDIQVEEPDGKRDHGVVDFSTASEGYFGTLGIPLLAGRDFGVEDQPASPKTAIVNQAFARRFFGGSTPLDRSVDVVRGAGPDFDRYQIVGLVGDTKYRRLRDGFGPIVFLPSTQSLEVGYSNLLARGPDPAVLGPTIRRIVADVDPSINLDVSVLETRVREGLVQERLIATLSAVFGLLAVVLATIGLYGVLAYLVARRTNEVGLRMALGADRRRIVGMILKESIGLAAAGLAVGTGLTAVALKLSTVALFELKATDPATFAIGTGILGGAALLAGYLPGRRAARIDPMEALRAE